MASFKKNVDDDKENFMMQRGKADGTSDLEERLNRYIAVERENAVNSLAEEEKNIVISIESFP